MWVTHPSSDGETRAVAWLKVEHCSCYHDKHTHCTGIKVQSPWLNVVELNHGNFLGMDAPTNNYRGSGMVQKPMEDSGFCMQ